MPKHRFSMLSRLQAERTSSGFFPSPATRFKLDFSGVRGDFLKFIESKHHSKAHEIALINNLDRYVTVIEKPMDIINIFSRLTVGQQHNLNRATRALFNLYELMGVDKDFLATLRKAVPKDETGLTSGSRAKTR